MTPNTSILAVDGNALVHRSFHALASSGLRTSDGRPTWALKGFVSQLLGAIERVGAQGVIVGFDDPTSSTRRARWPHYKASRSEKPEDLKLQLASAVELVRAMGLHVVVPDGLEADDVMASAATFGAGMGWRTTIVTSDRDSFALIDDTTSVLRLVTGGLGNSPVLTPDRLFSMIGVQPGQYRQYAAMRGDASDNLPGIAGIGDKTAAKILAAFGSATAALEDIDRGGERVARECGKAVARKLSDTAGRAAFLENLEVMTMHRDVDLHLGSEGAEVMLPVDPKRLAAALDSYELTSLQAYAARVLAGAHASSTPRTQTDPYRGSDDPGHWTMEPPPEQIEPDDSDPWAREPEPAGAAVSHHPAPRSGQPTGSAAPRPLAWSAFL